jgi:glycosyltransferase involved in cell wall biosynthesis
MRLSILVPCFNEEHTIRKLLNHLFSQIISVDFEVVIVDDGSKIRLKPTIQDYLNKYENIHYFRLKKNSGKGSAIRFAISKSKYDYLLIQDADLEYDPKDIPKMLKTLESNSGEVIYGSRFLRMPKGMSSSHFFGNKLLTEATNFLYKTHLTDMETGYKLFPKKSVDLKTFKVNDFEIEPVLTVLFIQQRIKIIEIPISYQYRLKGNAKIHVGDGIQALMILIKYRYFPKSRFIEFLYQLYSQYLKKVVGFASKIMKSMLNTRFEMK